MGFDKRENAGRYVPREGDTLKSIAERESAAGNPVTWQELARFNWGTDDEDEINAFLRDELGAHKRDDNNNFIISPEDRHQGELLIPKVFSKAGLHLDKTHVISIRKRVASPQFLECSSIPGATFEYDKSFLRPSVVEHIQPVEKAIVQYPEAKIIVFGHTDKVGSETYNKKLSERRALSVYAFIIDDPDTWESLYQEEEWGIRVIQEILKDLATRLTPGQLTDSIILRRGRPLVITRRREA